MINLDQAATIAKDFLNRTCGYLLYELQEIDLTNDRWVVTYKSMPFIGTPTLYKIEVDRENGEVLSFKRGS